MTTTEQHTRHAFSACNRKPANLLGSGNKALTWTTSLALWVLPYIWGLYATLISVPSAPAGVSSPDAGVTVNSKSELGVKNASNARVCLEERKKNQMEWMICTWHWMTAIQLQSVFESLASYWNWSRVFTLKVSHDVKCWLNYLIWLVILKPTTDSLFSPTDSIVIVSSTSGSVANTLRGNLHTPPEAADIINWVLWLEEQTTKSAISESQNLLQLFLASDNHSIELETDWRPAVLVKRWVFDRCWCKHMCFFHLPKWLERWKDEIEQKNDYSWHLILDLSQQTHAQGSFKTWLTFCVVVNKFIPTGEGMTPF